MRSALAAVLLVGGCASRVTPMGGDANVPEVFDASAGAGSIDVPNTDAPHTCNASSCDAGLVCRHVFVTHDPPGPLPDGSTCMPGFTQAHDRCWHRMDECLVPDQGCTYTPNCSCPPLQGDLQWQQGCECASDMTLNCYAIGI